MKKILIGSIFLLGITLINPINSRATDKPLTYKYYLDYVMGPYLFISHIPYDAVFLNGARLGFKMNRSFDFSIEYVAGQQQDEFNTLGLTHNANLQFAYFPNRASKPFTPYLFAGGGFLEFKSFTNDVYGFQFHGGAGTTIELSARFSGIIESRYFTTRQLDLGGSGNQLAVFWGIRAHL